MMITDKLILDACCGSKMFWFDKNNPDVLFLDIREGEFHCSNGRTVIVSPDQVADFRNLPFDDNTFQMVVFDPPHRRDLTDNNWMQHTYGQLFPTWEADIKAGFDECMRVLKPKGVLIFKWSEDKIKTKRILNIIKVPPLFGHTTGTKTIWMAFMKLTKP